MLECNWNVFSWISTFLLILLNKSLDLFLSFNNLVNNFIENNNLMHTTDEYYPEQQTKENE